MIFLPLEDLKKTIQLQQRHHTMTWADELCFTSYSLLTKLIGNDSSESNKKIGLSTWFVHLSPDLHQAQLDLST